MHDKTNKCNGFWQELKDRNVIRVMTVYIAAAFGFLELIDIISGPLKLPGWVLSVVMISAVIGFPLAFLLSWLFPGSLYRVKQIKPPEDEPLEDIYHTDIEQDLTKTEVMFHAERLIPDQIGELDEKSKVKPVKGKVQLVSVSSLVVIAAAVLLFLFYSGKTVPFKERGWILITDFENNTNEEIFDNSLNTAFALSINQSRYINVIPQQRMFETLKRMKIEGWELIDEKMGKEIAIREGVDVYIVPSISRVGSQYILTVKIQEAKTEIIFRSEVIYAKSQDDIIEKMDQLCKKVRRNLGESRYKISGQNKPLSEVTTSSLDALKQFSLGIENHLNIEFGKAVIHYKNAIEIDSGFTSAKASLGNILFERFDRDKGREWLDQAILSVNDLTDHEKYNILTFYAVNIENNLEKGIEYTKTILELYPDDPVAYNNLGWYYQSQGEFVKAAEEYKTAIRINPHLMLSLGGLIWIYLELLGQIDSAMVWSEKMIEAGPENPWGYYYLGSVNVAMDNLERAAIEYTKAIEVLKELLHLNPTSTPAYYDLGLIYNAKGDVDSAKSHFLEYKKRTEHWIDTYPDDPTSYLACGAAYAQLDEKDIGWEIGIKALEIDSTIHFDFAQFLTLYDKKSEALVHLEKALESGYRDLPWIKLNPGINLLSDDARFQDLINEYFK